MKSILNGLHRLFKLFYPGQEETTASERNISDLSEGEFFDMIDYGVEEEALASSFSSPSSFGPPPAKRAKKSPPPAPLSLPSPSSAPSYSSSSSSTSTSSSGSFGTALWTDKYRPRSHNDLIGNPFAFKKIHDFLADWHTPPVLARGKGSRAANQATRSDSFIRALLVSGSPGVGKTSAVHVIAEELGFKPVEFNASDTRSKLSLQAHIQSMVGNTGLEQYFKPGSGSSSASSSSSPGGRHRRIVLIMDEIDGMGAGDRGGLAELSRIIKESRIPIICCANDASSPKMRGFASQVAVNHVRLSRPTVYEIRPRIQAILKNEGLQLDGKSLDKLISSTNNDIRQTITTLQLWRTSSSRLSYEQVSQIVSSKDLDLGPFDVAPKFFDKETVSQTSLNERAEFFFVDYSIMPLFVQEAYLRQVLDSIPKLRQIEIFSIASDFIAMGDILQKRIRSEQEWSLLPLQAILSCVAPGSVLASSTRTWITFPQALGKISSQGKNLRLQKDIQLHMRSSGGGSMAATRLDFIPVLKDRLILPLARSGETAIPNVISLMDAYHLTRDDWDTIASMSLPMGKIQIREDPDPDNATTTAFTKQYNSTHFAQFSGAAERVTVFSNSETSSMDETEPSTEVPLETTAPSSTPGASSDLTGESDEGLPDSEAAKGSDEAEDEATKDRLVKKGRGGKRIAGGTSRKGKAPARAPAASKQAQRKIDEFLLLQRKR